VRISNLTVINAILFVAESGCKWRTLPPRFGKWHTVYTRMRRWADAGVLEQFFDALQEHHNRDPSQTKLILQSLLDR
jgi:transposase